MTLLARETGPTREALYKALGDKENPTLDTLVKVTRALGLRLSPAVQAERWPKLTDSAVFPTFLHTSLSWQSGQGR